jgi:hypothetical protein
MDVVEARRQPVPNGPFQLTMWLFFILVGLGLVFLVYVLIEFFRDTKPETSMLQRGSDAKTWNSAQSGRKPSSSRTHTDRH